MSFEAAMQVVLEHEGGYSNVAQDSGGATNHGITIHTLSRWRGHAVSEEDVKQLSVAEATQIYKAYYWDINKLDHVKHDVLQLVLFDQGVLRGPQTAVIAMQRILMLMQDGIVGPMTLDALNSQVNPAHLAVHFMCEMQLDYVRIVKRKPSQIVFLDGWLRRTQDLLIRCV